MLKVVQHTIEKIAHILSTAWGWLAALGLTIVNYFSAHSFVVFLVVAVTLMDAVWGIILSHRRGVFTLSELARQTVAKLAVYGSALFVFVGLDKIVDSTISASIVGAVIALVEFWSTCAIMLILHPHIPLLHLLKKALTGEIATKLHISADEVEEALRKGLPPKRNNTTNIKSDQQDNTSNAHH